jgi:hypothetical protein
MDGVLLSNFEMFKVVLYCGLLATTNVHAMVLTLFTFLTELNEFIY